MKSTRSALLIFMLLCLSALLFVWYSSYLLPAQVASHFDVSGKVNGVMPRHFYIGLMLVLIVSAPVSLVILPLSAFRNPKTKLNLPHKAYWLAPERRAETVTHLSRQAIRFASLVLVFLCYMHGLVVWANQSSPALLSTRAALLGLIVFLLATLMWIFSLLRMFRLN
ncbi:MAG TPA: DUF1648 domain-containing protein [Pseudomonadales bacterium]|nr:DUF1648 domain-containing protein [Pseudomonadales bacterium]